MKKKLDISNWKAFRVEELFEVINGAGITKKEIYEHPGYLPAIQSGEEAFGIIGTIDYNYCVEKRYKISKGPCLTVARSGSSGFVGYQPVQCVVGDSAKILEPKFEINRYRLLFIRALLMVNKPKYAYVDKVTSTNYKQDTIFLPVNQDNTPDWQYMENFMKDVEKKIEINLYELNVAVANNKPNKIIANDWIRFHLYDENLFTIDSGTKLDRIKMTNNNPSVNFVGRANTNNGVTDYVDKIEGLEPYAAGYLTISLGGEYLGSCFIQDKPFYTSQNVNVLIPKHPISDYCKRFIATMIFREGRLHYKAFIDELNRHMKTDFSILLPVTSDNTPDWDYMDNYMRKVEKKAQNLINALSRISNMSKL